MKKSRIFTCIIFLTVTLPVFLWATPLYAANFAGEIVEMDGEVFVTVQSTGRTVSAKSGMKVSPGDVIETKEDGIVEILFDDGNVTVLDEESQITIQVLSVEKDKSSQSILGLAFGKIKNRVSELANKRSIFEIHSKSAVAGVRGTPDWVVGIAGGKTEVDLLGKTGEKGSVFVKGKDPGGKEITVQAGFRTTVAKGQAPVKPFIIKAVRFQRLQRIMPIRTPEKKRIKKRKALAKKVEEEKKEKKDSEKNSLESHRNTSKSGKRKSETMMDHITQGVSIPSVKTDSETGENTESQLSQGENSLSGSGETSTANMVRVKLKVILP